MLYCCVGLLESACIVLFCYYFRVCVCCVVVLVMLKSACTVVLGMLDMLCLLKEFCPSVRQVGLKFSPVNSVSKL